MGAVLVKNADRMMTSANPVEEGIELAFADGCRGLVPFADIPEVKGLPDLVAIDLPNPYQLVLRNSRVETIDFPWDFARRYCDPSYRPRVEAGGALGRQTLGRRSPPGCCRIEAAGDLMEEGNAPHIHGEKNEFGVTPIGQTFRPDF